MRMLKVIALLCVIMLGTLAFSQSVHAQPPAPPPPAPAVGQEGAQEEEGLEIKKELYYYESEMLGRRDPFLSLIMAREKEQEEDREAPPLQKYDLTQMRLYAVVLTQDQQYAMVLLPDSKYYTVRKGDKIGIHDGYVAAMSLDTVTVIEQIRDYKNRIIKKETLLRLRAEEGE